MRVTVSEKGVYLGQRKLTWKEVLKVNEELKSFKKAEAEYETAYLALQQAVVERTQK